MQEQLPSHAHGSQEQSCDGGETQMHPPKDNMQAIKALPATAIEIFIFCNPFQIVAIEFRAIIPNLKTRDNDDCSFCASLFPESEPF